MCQSELTQFFAELTEFAAELSEFSLPKQYSRNSIPLPFPIMLCPSLVLSTPRQDVAEPPHLALENAGRCPSRLFEQDSAIVGRTPRGSCNRTLLRRVLRRFFKGSAFLEGFLEGTL